MSAAPSATSRRKTPDNPSKSQSKSDQDMQGPWRTPIAMKSRPGLFKVLLAVLIVWCGVMVWMYFREIQRSGTTTSPRSPTSQPESARLRGVARATTSATNPGFAG